MSQVIRGTASRAAAIAASIVAAAAFSTIAAGAEGRVIAASVQRISLGTYLVWAHPPVLPNYAGAIKAFGTPTSCVLRRGQSNDGIVHWETLGVTAEFISYGMLPNGGDVCSEPAAFQLDHLTVTGRAWRTSNGLRIGSPASKIAAAYPKALPHGSSWWIIIEKNVVGTTSLYPLYSAGVSHGRIASFTFRIGAEGD